MAARKPSRQVPVPASATSAAASACAAELLEVVPAVMDAVRATMRHNVDDELSVPQFRCLNYIARDPGCSVGAVAAFLGVKMPTASAMVDRLVRADAVSLVADPADRRRSMLTVTSAGREHLKRIRARAHVDLSATLEACGAPELRTLSAALDILRRTFVHS